MIKDEAHTHLRQHRDTHAVQAVDTCMNSHAIAAYRQLCTMSGLQIEFMQHLGLSIPQIERMIRRHPPWLV